MNITEHSHWYAIQCSNGKEKLVRDRFDKLFQNYRSFFPKRILRERKKGKVNTVVKPLFGGYFFFQYGGELLYSHSVEMLRILNEIGVSAPAFRVLGMNVSGETKESKQVTGDRAVAAVQDDDIHLLFSLTDQEETIHPSVLYREGQHVKIAKGALKGHEGLILKFDKRKGRVKIRLPFLGGERVVDLGAEML